MGLEADDGRPETSPPPRRGVQTADRAVVRERQAIPGDQGRARHRAIDPAAPGPGHPRQRLRPGPRTTARPGGTSRSSRGGATGGWRWRWTFQNKRRRYSHEGRRDTGQRRPLPDIGAMRDTGRSPLHLLLDDRASRDGACGSDRRRRARGPARRPRTLRRQEDQGRPGKEGRHRVQETHRRHHARTGHDGRVRARTVRTAQDAGRRGRLANLPDPRVRRLRPTHASGGRSCLCPRRRRPGVRVSAGRPGGQGHRRPFRRTDPGRKPGIGRVRHPRLPAGGRPENRGLPAGKGPQAPLPVF